MRSRFAAVVLFGGLGVLAMAVSGCGTKPPPCATSCTGCCTADGTCSPGTSNLACGTNGTTCKSCSGNDLCIAGSCQQTSGTGGGVATGGGSVGGGSTAGGSSGGGTGGAGGSTAGGSSGGMAGGSTGGSGGGDGGGSTSGGPAGGSSGGIAGGSSGGSAGGSSGGSAGGAAGGGTVIACGSRPLADHLLLSEVRTTPTPGEAVEIYNPTTATISLTNYRLYNASFTGDGGSDCHYYDHVTNPTCGTGFGDFDLQFPAGSTIAPNQALVIAITGNTNYRSWCDGGCTADFEIPAPDGGDDQNVPNMQGVWDQNGQNFTSFGFLTNGSEDLVLYSWNGSTSSQVVDLDYFIWGTSTSVRTSKTGIGTYLADTPTASQRPVTQTAAVPLSFQRACYNEGTETSTAGNGLSGHDETSEDLNTTWTVGPQSMGSKTPNTVP